MRSGSVSPTEYNFLVAGGGGSELVSDGDSLAVLLPLVVREDLPRELPFRGIRT